MGETSHWSGYEVFSILSGVALLVMAMLPGVKTKDRLWAIIGGVLIGGYGFHVHNQTSGTYYFSWQIFVLPFLIAGYVIYTLVKRKHNKEEE